ncbi:MAG: GTP-binding protein [bacterium]|nr:GTP-binding protein [bacterium]
MQEIPVYLFTGFLESGKTSFIRDTISDPDFIDGEKTLIILCEEGVEEYDEVALAKTNVDIVTVEEQEELTTEFIKSLESHYKPARVLIEYNGMWKVEELVMKVLPKNWPVVQVITTIDATTYEMYNNNMKSLLMDQVAISDLVVFNRCKLDMKKGAAKRSIRAFNRKATVYFEAEDGSPLPETEDDLPFDISPDEIVLEDYDFGTWYMDAMDHPNKYAKKKVKFLATVYKNRNFPKDVFVPGRFAMTCCADDIAFIGFVCHSDQAEQLQNKEWVTVEADVRIEYRKEYKGKGPVLYATNVERAEKPEEDLVYFN